MKIFLIFIYLNKSGHSQNHLQQEREIPILHEKVQQSDEREQSPMHKTKNEE